MIRSMIVAAAVAAAVRPAVAADVAYAGPAGWSHVDVGAPSDPKHAIAQWHISGDDVATVTFIRDGVTPYADALANIQKNFAQNNIKPATNKDVACRGKTAHVVEFSTGPEGKKISINRMLVPDGDGVMTLTYTRSDGSTYDPDVAKSVTAFCAATP